MAEHFDPFLKKRRLPEGNLICFSKRFCRRDEVIFVDEEAGKLKEYMDESGYTVALTGSGICRGYGMRRFKHVAGENGWAKKVTPDYIKSRPEEVYALFKDAFLDATFKMGPGPVHYQLTELQKKGKLQGIVTQNLDYLHNLAGSENVVAFMGSFADTVCLDCGARYEDINVWNHGEIPKYEKCGGSLAPLHFSRFGQRFGRGGSAGSEFMEQAKDMIEKAELLVVIGTTGFHSDEYLARLRPSTRIVQINPGSTMFDSMAELNIRMDAEQVFNQILDES